MVRWVRWWRQVRRDRRALMVLWTCAALGRATADELVQVTGLTGVAVAGTLDQLEHDGAVTREWEGVGAGRRRYHTVTEYGDRQSRTLAAKLSRAWIAYGTEKGPMTT